SKRDWSSDVCSSDLKIPYKKLCLKFALKCLKYDLNNFSSLPSVQSLNTPNIAAVAGNRVINGKEDRSHSMFMKKRLVILSSTLYNELFSKSINYDLFKCSM